MGEKGKRIMNIPINDIRQCIQQAQSLQRVRERDKRFWQAFSYLAGDSTTGFLAYVIWRGRSNMLTCIENATNERPAYKIHPEPA